jgi:hypothetical protein
VSKKCVIVKPRKIRRPRPPKGLSNLERKKEKVMIGVRLFICLSVQANVMSRPKVSLILLLIDSSARQYVYINCFTFSCSCIDGSINGLLTAYHQLVSSLMN